MLLRDIHGSGLRKDRSGGIEGLPLQLMILILIATLATAIIIGWMGNISTPDAIGDVTVDKSGVTASVNYPNDGYYVLKDTFTVYVTDQNGDPLKDAIVTLSGQGVRDMSGKTVYTSTNADGKAVFKSGNIKMKMRSTTAFITIEVSKPGYGEDSSCKIAIIS